MTPEERRKMMEDFAAETKKLAKPIDFNDLETKGILSKEGAWYRVHNFKNLPEHVRAKVSEICQDDKGIKIKLNKSSDFDKLAKKFEKLGL